MPKSYKTCEICQQAAYMTVEQIEHGLDHNAIKDYAWVLHDKDYLSDGSPKAPHYHIMLRFKDSVQTSQICSWFGVKENYINRIHGSFADALAYLTHKNAPEKHAYLDEEVKSNFDFKKEADSIRTRQKKEKRRLEIVEMIQSGEIREYNYTEYITASEYDAFKRTIDNAFNFRKDRLEGMQRDMTVIYVYGASGSGKTTYAKKLASDKGYSFYVSSSSNDIFDNYKGQDCIILDDLRPFDMELSDLLKILDNNTSSTVRSRYRNKLLECKLMIITTSVGIEEFYQNLLSLKGDSKQQIKRRIELVVSMSEKSLNVYIYQPETGKHDFVGTYDNPVAEMFVKKNRSKEEAFAYVAEQLQLGDPDPASLTYKQFALNLKDDEDLPFK